MGNPARLLTVTELNKRASNGDKSAMAVCYCIGRGYVEITDHRELTMLYNGFAALQNAPKQPVNTGTINGKMRKCGICERADIPYGVDWPHWVKGSPVHAACGHNYVIGHWKYCPRCDSEGDTVDNGSTCARCLLVL